ncbi:MAG: alpha/beta hydrolase [Rhodobacteraceae bacterium]|nr:MAG: alpha/beta hydrolase [Paracoccaceae bacterium]
MTQNAPFFADVSDAPPPERVSWLSTQDGTRLRAAFWPAGPKGMVAIFPGRTEVIEKYGRVVRDLAAGGFGASVIDWRGQGLSDRLPDTPLRGHVEDFALYQQDVAAYRTALDAVAPDVPRFLLAHSMGGCIGLRALIDGFPVQACAFSAPMWGLRLSPLTQRAVAAVTTALGFAGRDRREVPGAGVEFRLWENPFDRNEFTQDRDSYAYMQRQVREHPDLRLGAPSLRWLVAALAETRALSALPAPRLPAYCGLGTREALVTPQAIESRMGNWPDGRLDIFDGGLHELLMETQHIRTAFLTATMAHFEAHLER